MSAEQPLPHILSRPPLPPLREHVTTLRSAQLGKVATLWLGRGANVYKGDREKHVLAAFASEARAAEVVRSLGARDREVLSAFRRYGGTVNGAVLRLDLMTRGVLEVEEGGKPPYTSKRWRHNPIPDLAERLALLRPNPGHHSYHDYGYGAETDRPFLRYSLNAALAKHLPPAPAAPWQVPPWKGTPVAVTRRSPAEVALDLARLYGAVAGRGAVRLNKSGALGGPALKSLSKAVPLEAGDEFVLPDPQALYLELLSSTGAVQVGDTEAWSDPAAANHLFGLPTTQQAHAWARAWLAAENWLDGTGVAPRRQDLDPDSDDTRTTARHILAWALSCLAHPGENWFDLKTFLGRLQALYGPYQYGSPGVSHGWDPQLPEARYQDKIGEGRFTALWFDREGKWFANALMVTLVHLGLVERGRTGPGAEAGHCFRLTGHGRAVFGAPELPAVAEPADERFLVVQPNFDVLAYLDRSSAASATFLGRLIEAGAGGVVRTGRLTQASVYEALEAGVQPAGVLTFLRQNSQNELPANLVQSLSDWFARRETMVLRTQVTVRAFRSAAERDAHLARHGGTACGEHFAIGEAAESPARGELVVDHAGKLRRTLRADERGEVTAEGVCDLVQEYRLRRLAGRSGSGWRLNAESLRRARADGLKPPQVWAWLEDHLALPVPDLLRHAIDAWLGILPVEILELNEAVLLQVPDEHLFTAIAESPRLRPLLAGVVAKHWLLVRRERRAELEAVLAELGLPVGTELKPGGFKG